MSLDLEPIKKTIARYPGSERPNYQQLAALVAEVERLCEALHFYADPEHWEPTLVHQAPAGGPNPCASVWESGAAIDGGDRARRALNSPVAP